MGMGALNRPARQTGVGRSRLVAVLTATTAIAAVLQPMTALAQSAATPTRQAAPAAGARAYAIPAGSLAQALNRFADASQLQLIYSGEATRSLRSGGLNGTFTRDQALARLLAGSGLTYRFTNPTTVTIQRPAAAGTAGAGAAPEGAIALDTIDVQGPRNGTIGYVATRSTAGSRIETPIIETPRSVSVVTRQELDDRGVQTPVEAVRYSAGVMTGTFGFDPRFDQIYIRGFPITTFGDYRDGLRQPAGSYATFRTEPYQVDRFDILKGPASVLYGQSTPGGIIDRISKLPTDTPIREVTGQFGSFGRLQGAFDIGGPIDGERQFLYRVVGVARTGDTNFHIADKRLLLAPSFTWRPSDQTTLTVYGLAQKDETDGNVAALNRSGQIIRIRASDPSYDFQRQNQYQIGYRFDHRFDDILSIRQHVRYSAFDVTGRYLTGGVTGGGWDPNNPNIYRRGSAAVAERLDVFQADNQLRANLMTGPISHTVVTGLDYMWYASRFGTGTLAANPAYALNVLNPVYGLDGPTPAITSVTGLRQEQTGLYVQDQMKLGNWRLSLAARQDFVTQTQSNLVSGAVTGQRANSALTYSAGLLYLFDSGIAPYVSYARSFQPVTSLDVNGNMLAPSRGEQVEAGIKYQAPDGRLSATFSAYQLTEQNAPKYAGFNAFAYYVSVGEIRTRGFEVEGRARLTDEFDVLASYTFADATITASNTATEIGKVPAVTPRHTASIWGNYTVRSGSLIGVSGGVGFRYVGPTYGNNTNTLRNEAYGLVDAALRYDLGQANRQLQGMTVALNVTNLFDKQVGVCNAGYCYLSQGRTVLGTLKYQW
jgi:iron complex outermembrane receptor protein